MSALLTGVRNATLEDMVTMLRDQQAAKLDVVAPATALRSRNAAIELSDVEPTFDENGVTVVDGLYVPTAAADATIADKLGISLKYLRRLREQRPDLYDANVNGWLHGRTRVRHGQREVLYPADDRSFLLRTFRSQNSEQGVLRALLSDRFGIIDNLDVLTAVLDGIRQADAEVEVRACDLSDSSMHCKVYSPSIATLAPHFLRNYRNPFANPELEAERRRVSGDLDQWRRLAQDEGMGYEAGEEPVMFAGFRFSNSEIGGGSVTLKPELFVKICRNGLTLPLLALRKIHVGAKMDNGTVTWSQDTQNKHLAVLTAQTRDAVRQWLTPEFLTAQVAQLEQQAGAPVTEPEKTLKVVAKRLGFTESERDGVLSHFIAGGQLSAAGVANAITSYSQTIADPDRADTLDDLALSALALVQ
ncbi:hypothetical protein GCM10012275_42760 [Longimycelium tulufanense]|uniref:DUF932 domain-containing protein n=1 Tax=Longimycelium tulufanense TaxID=907463 RepID=A0A8J3CFF0_9PSEU|nr:hypothetical protein [Longimycelium tulufanense]GGM67633.1 hypothetical protein GCM10012275_42760 [Longimycelium tulufanense]